MTSPSDAAATADFGTASALKRGRNPRWPYVPVIIHNSADRPGLTTQEQIKKAAFATRDEAIAHAESVIRVRRNHLAARLAMPNNRALRVQHGVA